MKQSKTLTNEEIGETALRELEDPIMKTCTELVETIEMQLRKKRYSLSDVQKETLKEYIRKRVNLNITINAGIGMNELDKADVFPTPINTKKLDSFTENKSTSSTPETGSQSVTLTKDHIEKLNEAAKKLKKEAEDQAHTEERKRRAAEAAQV